MSTTVEMSYSFLTVCTWFQTMSTPYETSDSLLIVCTVFKTMSQLKLFVRVPYFFARLEQESAQGQCQHHARGSVASVLCSKPFQLMLKHPRAF